VDSKTKLIHSVAATPPGPFHRRFAPSEPSAPPPANAHDSTALEDLLHGGETRVWGDQAYRGQREVIRRCAPRAKDFTNRRRRLKGIVDEAEKARNARKSKVRAKVEHCFGVMKRVFGFTKVRYRGINKNADWLFASCALVNLFMVRRCLLPR
jgi:IS5 family transposase